MSTIAAKIFSKYHDHSGVYREVGQRHRLSYADLDALLDREERQLAEEKQRHNQHVEDGSTPQNPFFVPEVAQQERSRSSSSGSEDDEGDWPADKHAEDDLLLEFEESETNSIHTVSGAEDHLIKDIDSIVHVDITEEQLQRMHKLLTVNCLHRGDIVNVQGKRWMVAVDGTEASLRAFQSVLKLMEAEDHLLVVTVRDKNLPQRFAVTPSEEVQLRFELWKSARHILKPFMDELSTRLEEHRYSVMIPDAWDARRLLCKLCKRYNIDTLCVGRHSKGEHNHHHWHLRSLHSYTAKHAKCPVIVF